MAIAKIVGAQRDFSAGELDESAKRADENPVVKDGGRQMSNWRVLSPKSMQNRSGRIARFLATGRTEIIIVPGGASFFLNFGAGTMSMFDGTGALVATTSNMQLVPGGTPVAIPWTLNTVGGITYAQIGNKIYLAFPDGFPNNVPQVLTYTAGGSPPWVLSPYAETVTAGGQKRTLFYRISPQNVTLQPSAVSGNINITFSSAILTGGMVGTRLRYCGRELTITGVSNSTTGTATVNQPLPPGQTLSYTTLAGTINIGDVVIGGTTGAQGIVTATSSQQSLLFISNINYTSPSFNVGDTVTQASTGASGITVGWSYLFDGTNYRVLLTVSVPPAGPFFAAGSAVVGPAGSVSPVAVSAATSGQITVQLIPTGSGDVSKIIQFAGTETVGGPSGSFALTANSVIAPQAVSVWDDEVMNLFRGYPSSVFADQSRLGFTNFAAVPAGIAWSAIGLYTDLYVGALPSDAIFELAPDNSQVFYVMAGMESSEFVFTDRAIYYIPITPAVPLEPGNAAFNKLSDYGCLPNVQPRRAEQSIIYFKAGGTQVGAVQAPGAYYRPYVVDHISEMHSHLFVNQQPTAIAVPSGPAQFAETYIYISLKAGGLVVGKYSMRQGLIEPGAEGKPAIGWMPWTGAGTASWVAAYQGFVIFTTGYGAVSIVEQLDDNQILDGAVLVNNIVPPLTPPGGKGPLYVFPGPNTTVYLYNNGTPYFSGVYHVDANGFLIAQGQPGENLASLNLIAGEQWTAVFEPWAPEAPPGQSQHQRLLKRRVSHLAVRVSNSTGFVMARLFSGPITPSTPPLGTIMNTHRVPTFMPGENTLLLPPQREDAFRWRPIGRSFDPRISIIKDTPGSLMINEVTMEITV